MRTMKNKSKAILTSTHEVKGSKFLSFFVSHHFIESALNSIYVAHPKAVHFVRAARYFNEFSQIIEQCSDDGEPKGSSGLPCLNVLRGEKLVNIDVVVVRYFGGVKLGIGGLVRAYTSATLAGARYLKDNELLEPFFHTKMEKVMIDIKHFSRFNYLANKFEISILSKEFKDCKILLNVSAEESSLDMFLELLYVENLCQI